MGSASIETPQLNNKPKIRKILSSGSASSASQGPLSNSSSSTSLSLGSRSEAPYIKYQTSPLCTMSSIEYQRTLKTSRNSSQVSLFNMKSNKQQQQKNDEPLDYLEYLEKQPVYPPTYAAASASKKVNFPVYEQEETHILPDYSPSVYQVALALKKTEWLSPYEPSPIRNWKNVVMELNSTQLNFYSIDSLPLLNRVKKSKTKKYYEFTPIESDYIINAVKQKPNEFLTPKRLIKSYSLQFARFGLPVDYKKKNNCLRVRAETEQFILHFHTIDEMISWSNHLSTGINVSLDLETRKMPADRTVPRRRRNRRGSSSNRNRSYSDSELIRRELSTPAKRRSSFSGESSIKGKISRLFNKRRPDVSLNEIEELASKFQQQTIGSGSSSTPSNSSSSQLTGSPRSKSATRPAPISLRSSSTSTSSSSSSIRELTADSLSRTATAEEAESIRYEISTIQEEEEENGEQEPNSIHELHDDSDDEDEEDEEIRNQRTLFNDFQLNFGDEDEKQWLPEHKLTTRRKFLKDSIRCIKLLPADEEWVGKCLVRSSTPPRFKTVNQINSKNSTNKFVREFIVGPQGLVAIYN